MNTRRIARTVGITALALGALAILGALLVRDQMARNRRELFSPHPVRRLAALGWLAGRDATIDNVQLLRDFIAWEPRPLLRRRALHILHRMERELEQKTARTGEVAG